jgi:hypothetical protein
MVIGRCVVAGSGTGVSEKLMGRRLGERVFQSSVCI